MKATFLGLCLLFFNVQKIANQEDDVNYGYKSQNQTLVVRNFPLNFYSSRNHQSDADVTSLRKKRSLNCENEIYEGNFTIHKNGYLFISKYNKLYQPKEFEIRNGKVILCIPQKLSSADSNVVNLIKNCEKRTYTPDKFRVLPNESVLLRGEILKNGTYYLDGDSLKMCIPVYNYNHTFEDSAKFENSSNTEEYSLIFYVSLTGSIISIISLLLHLVIFFLTSRGKHLPGYNLTSLTFAFLIAFSFDLIGRSPKVSGTFCVVSSVLELYFFLAGFFWMNVMSFDVMRDLELAVPMLITGENNKKRKKFNLYILYSLYAWGKPLLITVTALIMDNVKTSNALKPFFGVNGFCWFTNETANILFFIVPVFILLVVNGIFFGVSARVLEKKIMIEDTCCEHGEIKRNFALYARLCAITGITWFLGIAAIIYKKKVLYIIFDILSSLEGFFIFLIFSCTKNVWYQLSEIKFR